MTGQLVLVRDDLLVPTLEQVAEEYVRAGAGDAAARCRRQGVTRFMRLFATLAAWNAAPVADRMRLRTEVVSFAAFAAVRTRLPVEPTYAVASGCRWGKYQAAAYPVEATSSVFRQRVWASVTGRSTGCGRTCPRSPSSPARPPTS